MFLLFYCYLFIIDLFLQGWKNERVVYQNPFTASRIITIRPSDPKQWWKKVEEILTIVDKDLGLAEVTLSDPRDKMVRLLIVFYVTQYLKGFLLFNNE